MQYDMIYFYGFVLVRYARLLLRDQTQVKINVAPM